MTRPSSLRALVESMKLWRAENSGHYHEDDVEDVVKDWQMQLEAALLALDGTTPQETDCCCHEHGGVSHYCLQCQIHGKQPPSTLALPVIAPASGTLRESTTARYDDIARSIAKKCAKCGLMPSEHGDFGFRDHAFVEAVERGTAAEKEEICLGCNQPTAKRDCGCPAGTAMRHVDLFAREVTIAKAESHAVGTAAQLEQFIEDHMRMAFQLGVAKAVALGWSQAEKDGWQDIATAPKDGTQVWLWWDGKRRLAHWHEAENPRSIGGRFANWLTDDRGSISVSVKPTHWHALPPDLLAQPLPPSEAVAGPQEQHDKSTTGQG